MPNRADHSVKTSRSEPTPGLKTWGIALGTLTALIGALTVMAAGGAAGQLFGTLLLTIIIILQIFLRFVPTGPDQSRAEAVKEALSDEASTAYSDAPILIAKLSPLGRVQTVLGQRALAPAVRVGADLTDFSGADHKVSVLRIPRVDGSWLVLMPESAVLDGEDAVDRTQFFAGLGHDLKSPLNAVIGFAEIMDAEMRGPMPAAYKDYPGLIRDSGETLLRLVEDMLAYAKSETGTYELDPAPMDIAASGESVLRQSQAMADKAEVKLRMTGTAEVIAMADADAVRRIWDNLVSNAIKYSSPGDTVTLRAHIVGETSIIEVTDNGAGMDAEDLARIAQPFAQGRNAKGRAGTGLGLAMVQRLAEMQGGQVEIRTAPGTGTRVTVRLPASVANARRAAE
ncbi:MAG: HAMP domain-containing histidine kinase [Henriciella sp.]|nr:HAMP domain-containing histidine kinase [Henriciella sp.]